MEVPNVTRTEYQLLNIDGEFMNLMSGDGDAKDDVKLPDSDLGKEIEAAFEAGKDLLVTIIAAMGEFSCWSLADRILSSSFSE